MKFEDALKRLEEIVGSLEKGDVSLDDSLKLYEEGQELINFCKDKLTKAESKVKELIKTGQGKFELRNTDKH
ncbi:exodeoxyribonuclease VII small subunit [candidate division WOR-3 bacterium]|nr:exodeoxyribonuclease VII small subunit [candidate division WOR-3 bacterium]